MSEKRYYWYSTARKQFFTTTPFVEEEDGLKSITEKQHQIKMIMDMIDKAYPAHSYGYLNVQAEYEPEPIEYHGNDDMYV
jgi:hypothetical protein